MSQKTQPQLFVILVISALPNRPEEVRGALKIPLSLQRACFPRTLQQAVEVPVKYHTRRPHHSFFNILN